MVSDIKKIDTFRKEIENIEIDMLKEFVKEAILMVDDKFFENEEIILHTKKVYKIVDGIMKAEETKGLFRDANLVAVLLSDICLPLLPDEYKHLHPVAVKKYLQPVSGRLQQAHWDGIISIIEEHEGCNSPSDRLKTKAGSAGYIVALANHIARFDFVEIK